MTRKSSAVEQNRTYWWVTEEKKRGGRSWQEKEKRWEDVEMNTKFYLVLRDANMKLHVSPENVD